MSATETKAIAIVGPNGVGKTGVAYELARLLAGEVVNLDKIYLFRGFSIATGLADSEAQQGVPGHLYRLLDPDEPIIPPAEFVALVRQTVAEINERGKMAILEGGSTTYLPSLFVSNAADPFFSPVFAFSFAEDPREPISRRVTEAFSEGLLAEVEVGLETHPTSLIMNDAHFVTPLVEHLQGKLDLVEAKEKIVELCLAYTERQLEMLAATPGLYWIEHEKDQPERTLALIRAVLFERPTFA